MGRYNEWRVSGGREFQSCGAMPEMTPLWEYTETDVNRMIIL